MSKKGAGEAKSSGVVVGTGQTSGLHLGPRAKIIALYAAAAIVLGGIGTGVYMYVRHADEVRQAKVAKQKQLQKKVSDVNGVGDLDKLKADSNTLITGAAKGTYDVSTEELAQAYISRADAELNSKDYKAAVADYQKASKLDSSQKTAALYGEFLGRYRIGERKELVPLLQELQKPLKDDHESPSSQQQFATYDQYIADLQAGKDLEL